MKIDQLHILYSKQKDVTWMRFLVVCVVNGKMPIVIQDEFYHVFGAFCCNVGIKFEGFPAVDISDLGN